MVGAVMAWRRVPTIMAKRCMDPLNSIGFGTWAWGNKAIWGYDPMRDDSRLRATFLQALSSGLNLIDTADSYGTGSLTGRSEALAWRLHSWFATHAPITVDGGYEACSIPLAMGHSWF